MAKKSAAKPAPRERLLAACDELFYRDGVQSTGIDAVIEKAGVAKGSLYYIFGGKDELVASTRSVLRAIQRSPQHIRAYFRPEPVRYAA